LTIPKMTRPPKGQCGYVPNWHGAVSLIKARLPITGSVTMIGNQERAAGDILTRNDNFGAAIAVEICCQGPQPAAAVTHSTPGPTPKQLRLGHARLVGFSRVLERENLFGRSLDDHRRWALSPKTRGN